MSNSVHARRIRHERLRKRVSGSTLRPRLVVFRSSKHVYAQIVDDTQGKTLVSASTLDKDVKPQLDGKSTQDTDASALIGKTIAERALATGITSVVFDRGGYRYHGRIKALADAARNCRPEAPEGEPKGLDF